eukprot:PhM_4_TR3396/c0_g1_i1/m.33649
MTSTVKLRDILCDHHSLSGIGKMSDVTFSMRSRLRNTHVALRKRPAQTMKAVAGAHTRDMTANPKEEFIGAEVIEASKLNDFGTTGGTEDHGRSHEMLSSPRRNPLEEKSITNFLKKKRIKGFLDGITHITTGTTWDPTAALNNASGMKADVTQNHTVSTSDSRPKSSSAQHIHNERNCPSATFLAPSREDLEPEVSIGPMVTKYTPKYDVTSRRNPCSAYLGPKPGRHKHHHHQRQRQTTRGNNGGSPHSFPLAGLSPDAVLSPVGGLESVPSPMFLSGDTQHTRGGGDAWDDLRTTGAMNSGDVPWSPTAALGHVHHADGYGMDQRDKPKKKHPPPPRAQSPAFKSTVPQRVHVQTHTPEMRWPLPLPGHVVSPHAGVLFDRQTTRNKVVGYVNYREKRCGAPRLYDYAVPERAHTPVADFAKTPNPREKKAATPFPSHHRMYDTDISVSSTHRRVGGTAVNMKRAPRRNIEVNPVRHQDSPPKQQGPDTTNKINTIAYRTARAGRTVDYHNMVGRRDDGIPFGDDDADGVDADRTTFMCFGNPLKDEVSNVPEGPRAHVASVRLNRPGHPATSSKDRSTETDYNVNLNVSRPCSPSVVDMQRAPDRRLGTALKVPGSGVDVMYDVRTSQTRQRVPVCGDFPHQVSRDRREKALRVGRASPNVDFYDVKVDDGKTKGHVVFDKKTSRSEHVYLPRK